MGKNKIDSDSDSDLIYRMFFRADGTIKMSKSEGKKMVAVRVSLS